MPKCDFNKVAKQTISSLVVVFGTLIIALSFCKIFSTEVTKNTFSLLAPN